MKNGNFLTSIKFPRLQPKQPSQKKKPTPSSATVGYHINPRYRAFGRARLDLARNIHSQEEWEANWKAATHPYPFAISGHISWKFCCVYYVVDFAAEIGFWIDMIGMTVNSIAQDYVQFSSPDGEISFAVAIASDRSTASSQAIRLQFQIDNFPIAIKELEQRNIHLVYIPEPVSSEPNLAVATFTTPNGVPVDLWGEISPVSSTLISLGFNPQGLENTENNVVTAGSTPGFVKTPDEEADIEDEWAFTPFDEKNPIFDQTKLMEEPAAYMLPTSEPNSIPSFTTPKSNPVISATRSSNSVTMGLLKNEPLATSSPDENQVEMDHFEEKLVYEPLDQENDEEMPSFPKRQEIKPRPFPFSTNKP